MDHTASPHLPLIALERVNADLDGRPVLHDVTWRLQEGEQWAIIGPNGSGKSTLLRVIRGDLWPRRDDGVRAYALDGGPEPVGAAATRIGYVSPELQERYTRLDLAIDGRALVASGLHDVVYLAGPLSADDHARVDAIVERFGLQSLIDRPISALSFGQLRMLLIARALVRMPRVLILDECANGLDHRARGELVAFLEQVAGTTHVIVASHRGVELPATTTHHALIEGGRLVSTGSGLPPERRSATSSSLTSGERRAHERHEVLVAIERADVYRGEQRVLHQVEWSIRRGEHCIVRGPNGAGKSTFAGLIAGTIPAAHGACVIRFGEHGPFDLWALKRRIAHVSDALQTAYDANPTVEGVIASGFVSSIGVMHEPDEAELRIVHELMRKLALEPLSGRRFGTLSFGERRKVLIARALVHRPDVLILDEVWSGLDAAFRTALAALLDELAEGGTTLVVISHHDDDVPPFVRRTFVIDGGRIAAA